MVAAEEAAAREIALEAAPAPPTTAPLPPVQNTEAAS
jgi:hypothetical protein